MVYTSAQTDPAKRKVKICLIKNNQLPPDRVAEAEQTVGSLLRGGLF